MKKEIESYLEWKVSYAPRAAKVYKPHLERFATFSKKGVSEITRQDIVAYQTLIAKKYADSHIALALAVLKNFFKYLNEEGIPTVKAYTIKIPRYITKPYATLSFEEFKKIDMLLSVEQYESLQKKVAVHLLWYSGLRVSELRDMDMSMIDAEKEGAFIITKKSNNHDWIFWPRETHELIKYYLHFRLGHNNHPALFTNKKGQRISKRTFERWVVFLAKEAKINKKIVPHSFRHGRAHRILDLGGTVKDIQWWLRHSERNPAASFQYLRLNPHEREKRAKKLF